MRHARNENKTLGRCRVFLERFLGAAPSSQRAHVTSGCRVSFPPRTWRHAAGVPSYSRVHRGSGVSSSVFAKRAGQSSRPVPLTRVSWTVRQPRRLARPRPGAVVCAFGTFLSSASFSFLIFHLYLSEMNISSIE